MSTRAYTRAQRGATALIWTARGGRADCAQLLLDAGADKEARTDVRCQSEVCKITGLQEANQIIQYREILDDKFHYSTHLRYCLRARVLLAFTLRRPHA